MSEVIYNWKRYWYPRGQEPPLSPDGFLVPWRTDYAFFKADPDLFQFEAIAEIPCLFLLGEPGIGKSYAIKQASSVDLESSNVSLFIDLSEYDETDLKQKLVNILEQWASGHHNLHIFLDSLDEAQLRISRFSRKLFE